MSKISGKSMNLSKVMNMQAAQPTPHIFLAQTSMATLPTKLKVTEQVLIGDSTTQNESLSRAEQVLIGYGTTQNESLSRAEGVIISNT